MACDLLQDKGIEVAPVDRLTDSRGADEGIAVGAAGTNLAKITTRPNISAASFSQYAQSV